MVGDSTFGRDEVGREADPARLTDTTETTENKPISAIFLSIGIPLAERRAERRQGHLARAPRSRRGRIFQAADH
jgi:hypothetical protein